MLLRFQFSNYRSFRDEQEISFVASPSIRELPEAVIRSKAVPEGVLKSAALYGANASGKTNVLKAMKFVVDAVRDSFGRWEPGGPIPMDPFLLTPESSKTPSRFVLDFIVADVRYQYGFAVSAARVEEEWLSAFPDGRRQKLFARAAGAAIRFSRKLTGENSAIEKLTRPNALFLSTAGQANHPSLSHIEQWLTKNIHWYSPTGVEARVLLSLGHAEEVTRLVQAADVGISRVGLRPLDKNSLVARFQLARAESDEERRRLQTRLSKLEFEHMGSGGPVTLPEEEESTGTIGLARMAAAMLAYSWESVLLVDEFGSDFHPMLAQQLIRLMNSGKHEAQLLFATHDTNLIAPGVLRRDQVWFAEKDRQGVSHLYPLTDFRLRPGEDIQKGYLQGRFGAIPYLNQAELLAAVNQDNGKRKAKR